jgi:hypothetical protein
MGSTSNTGGGIKRVLKAKPLPEPKSNVKVVPAMPKGMRKAMNDFATAQSKRIASGKTFKSAEAAKEGAAKSNRLRALKLKEEAAMKEAAEIAQFIARGGRIVKVPAKGPVKKAVVPKKFVNDVRVITKK